jgi:hypothetical protein
MCLGRAVYRFFSPTTHHFSIMLNTRVIGIDIMTETTSGSCGIICKTIRTWLFTTNHSLDASHDYPTAALFDIGTAYELILRDPLPAHILVGISLQDIGGTSHRGWVVNMD